MSRQDGDFAIIHQLGDDGGAARPALVQRLFTFGDKSIPASTKSSWKLYKYGQYLTKLQFPSPVNRELGHFE